MQKKKKKLYLNYLFFYELVVTKRENQIKKVINIYKQTHFLIFYV